MSRMIVDRYGVLRLYKTDRISMTVTGVYYDGIFCDSEFLESYLLVEFY